MKRCAWISSRKQKTFANIWMVLVFWVYARVYLAIIKEMEFHLVPFLIFESSYHRMHDACDSYPVSFFYTALQRWKTYKINTLL